jgi:hypothetical protein
MQNRIPKMDTMERRNEHRSCFGGPFAVFQNSIPKSLAKRPSNGAKRTRVFCDANDPKEEGEVGDKGKT